jgi:nucleoside 2-deoxyribosyltransferase
MKPKLYIAGPLFSEAERDFNTRLRKSLSADFETFLPQEDGGLVSNLVKEGMGGDEALAHVFKLDIQALDWCDAILVVLDGRAIDEGAAFELGYAYANKKLCFGLQTDSRRLLPAGNNPMISEACELIFESTEQCVKELKDALKI